MVTYPFSGYLKEILYFNNSVSVASLTIAFTVPIINGASNPSCYSNFGGDCVASTTSQVGSQFYCTFSSISGKTVLAGQWNAVVQFNINNDYRPTNQDIYSVLIGGNSISSGHF